MSKPVTIKHAFIRSACWVVLALLFNLFVYFKMGKVAATNFLAGYLVEKALSVDNLFVFSLIFTYFHTPESLMRKCLFWGIPGAIIARGIFIFLGIELVKNFHWIFYVFGAFLVLTGLKLLFEKDRAIHPEKNPLLRLLRYFMPVTSTYEGRRFFIHKRGKWFATPLFVVVLTIEMTDIVFAIDSVPAILAITVDPFIVYTSNIFAILGLRDLFFVLVGMKKIFTYMHYGIVVILIFIGLKMISASFIKLSPFTTLSILIGILVASLLPTLFIRARK